MQEPINKGMQVHDLKSWPDFFEKIWVGTKKFEIRKNDRNYRPGDLIVLREYDPAKPEGERYSGRSLVASIGYLVAGGQFGLPEDLCVFSFKFLASDDTDGP